jgi:hypothetical protein
MRNASLAKGMHRVDVVDAQTRVAKNVMISDRSTWNSLVQMVLAKDAYIYCL